MQSKSVQSNAPSPSLNHPENIPGVSLILNNIRGTWLLITCRLIRNQKQIVLTWSPGKVIPENIQ